LCHIGCIYTYKHILIPRRCGTSQPMFAGEDCWASHAPCNTPIEDMNASNPRMHCSKMSFLSRSAHSSARKSATSRACSTKAWDVPSDGAPCERDLYAKHVPQTGVTFGPTYRTLPAYSSLPIACSYASFGAQRTMSCETLCVAAGSVDKFCAILSCTSST
jgi:hypothetical protein